MTPGRICSIVIGAAVAAGLAAWLIIGTGEPGKLRQDETAASGVGDWSNGSGEKRAPRDVHRPPLTHAITNQQHAIDGVASTGFESMTTGELIDRLLEACVRKNEDLATMLEEALGARIHDTAAATEVLDRVVGYGRGAMPLPEPDLCTVRLCKVLARSPRTAFVDRLVAELRDLWRYQFMAAIRRDHADRWKASTSPTSPRTVLPPCDWVFISALLRQFEAMSRGGAIASPSSLATAVQEEAAATGPVTEFQDPWLSGIFSICADLPALKEPLRPVAEEIMKSTRFSWPLKTELASIYAAPPRFALELADRISDPKGSPTLKRDTELFLLADVTPSSGDLMILAEALHRRTSTNGTGGWFSHVMHESAAFRHASAQKLASLMQQAFEAFLNAPPDSGEAFYLVQLVYHLSRQSRHWDEVSESFAARIRGAWLSPLTDYQRGQLSRHISSRRFASKHSGQEVPDIGFHSCLHLVLSEVNLDFEGSCAMLLEHIHSLGEGGARQLDLQSCYMGMEVLRNRLRAPEFRSGREALLKLLAAYGPAEIAKADTNRPPYMPYFYYLRSAMELLDNAGNPTLPADLLHRYWEIIDYYCDVDHEQVESSQKIAWNSSARLAQDFAQSMTKAGYLRPN